MKTIKKIKLIPLFFIIFSLFFLSACSSSQDPNNDNNLNVGQKNNDFTLDNKDISLQEEIEKQTEIKKFASLDDLKNFLEENQNNNNYLYNSRMGGLQKEMMVDTAMPSREMAMDSSEDLDYSETNVQVKGVDEADIIKTDGDNIYALSDNQLFLVSAYPGQDSKINSVIKFKNRPSNLYLENDKLVVIGYNYNLNSTMRSISILPRSSYIFVKIFNVEDVNNPNLEKEWEFEGSYSDSRLYDGDMYLISNKYNYRLADRPILPVILEDGNLRDFNCKEGDCLQPNVYYFPMPYNSYNYTNVYKISVSDLDKDIKSSTFLLSGGQNVYMSKDNLYLSHNSYLSQRDIEYKALRKLVYPYLELKEKEKINAIEDVESFILSEQEKQNKINNILLAYINSQSQSEQERWEKNLEAEMKDIYLDLEDQLESTVISKIPLANDNLEPSFQGQVPGTILNQFSIDEYQGNLRLATTKNNNWKRRFPDMKAESENNIYILDEELNPLSHIEGLAKDERIYSARFMQDKIYIVTFKQVDPLFVIDASNPKSLKVLGELKIPGFSNYLHPYNENTLIGFGKDTYVDENDNVRIKGLKLSLFDVTNPIKPKEIDTYLAGGPSSYSEVLNDHKALLFSKDKNLLVLPVSLRSPDYNDWENSFNGALVFNMEDKKFDLKGRIDHGQGENNWQGFRSNQVKRSLYIEDELYTFSDSNLKVNDIESLDLIKDIKLKAPSSDFDIINIDEEKK